MVTGIYVIDRIGVAVLVVYGRKPLRMRRRAYQYKRARYD
jgi:hypothetical protein